MSAMPTYLIINGATAHCSPYQRHIAIALAERLQLLLMLLLLEMMLVLDFVPPFVGEPLKGIIVILLLVWEAIVRQAVGFLCGHSRLGLCLDWLRLQTELLMLLLLLGLLHDMHWLHLLLVALEEPIEDIALGCSLAVSRRHAGMPVPVVAAAAAAAAYALHIGLIVSIVILLVGANLWHFLTEKGVAWHLFGQLCGSNIICIILVVLIIVIVVLVIGFIALRQLLPVGCTCGAWLHPGGIDAIAIKVARGGAAHIAACTHNRCICGRDKGGGSSTGRGRAGAADHCGRHAMLLMTQSGKDTLLPGGMMAIVMP